MRLGVEARSEPEASVGRCPPAPRAVRLEQRAAKHRAGDAEVDHEASDIDECRNERRRSRGRVEPEPAQNEGKHRSRDGPPEHDADQRQAHAHADQERMRTVGRVPSGPQGDAQHAQQAEQQAQGKAAGQLPAQDPPPVAQAHLAERDGADHQRAGLGARVAATRDDERDEERQHQRARQLALVAPHGRGREELADEEHREPDAPLAHHLQQADLQVGRVEGGGAAHLLDVLGRLLLHHVHDVVDRHDALHAPVAVQDRHGHQVVLRDQPGHALLIHVLGHGDRLLLHHVPHRAFGPGGEEIAERDHAQQSLPGIEHVDVVDGLDAFGRLPSQVGNGLVDPHLGPHAHEARAHEASRVVLRVGQQRHHFLARGLVQKPQQVVTGLFGRCLHQVCRVVGRQLSHPDLAFGPPETEQQVALLASIEGAEELLRLAGRQQLEAFDLLVWRKERPDLQQIRRKQARSVGLGLRFEGHRAHPPDSRGRVRSPPGGVEAGVEYGPPKRARMRMRIDPSSFFSGPEPARLLRPGLAAEVAPAAARVLDLLAMRLLARRLFGESYDGIAVQRTHVRLDPYLADEIQRDPLRLYPAPAAPEPVERSPAAKLLDGTSRLSGLPSWPSAEEPLGGAGLEREDFAFASAHRSIHPEFAAQMQATPENLRVHGRLYRAKGVKPRAAVVFAHGFADESLDLPARFLPAARLARMGLAVAFLSLPWHGPRKPAAARFHGEYFLSADLARTLESMLQAVSDVRSIVAWLKRDLGVIRVGVMGGSLGGCVATLTAAVAREIDFLVAVAPAIRISEGLQGLPLGREIAAGVARQAVGPVVVERLQRLADPSAFSPAVPPERMLFFAGRGDAFVTPAHLEALQRGWGRLDVRWHVAGHLTTLLALPPSRLFEETELLLQRIGIV